MPTPNPLADEVLPLIRTSAPVWRWSVANAHGVQMEEAVDRLRRAAAEDDPGVVFGVVQRAIRSAITVLLRADDSSGIIGGAVADLLALHAEAAVRARPPVKRLVDWMIDFQFGDRQDFFQLDPVAYAPALGESGLAAYRARLAGIAAAVGPDEEWGDAFTLAHNAQRLAVLDRDVDAVIATHVKDGKVAAWLEDAAEALEEIGRYDLAIEWAEKAAHHEPDFQAAKAAETWSRLIGEHRPDELLGVRLDVFARWPTVSNAAKVRQAAGDRWPDHEPAVLDGLRARPREAVLFALREEDDVRKALALLEELQVDDRDVRTTIADHLGKVDPGAALPLHGRLVQEELTVADAKHYRLAARRLAAMRRLARGTAAAVEVDEFVLDLRETHRRRPRLQEEFDRARLP